MLDKRTLDRLAALRRSLAAADGEADGTFSAVFHEFMDIAEGPSLIPGSKPTKNPIVEGAIERVAAKLAGEGSAHLQAVRMLGVAEAGLVHGGFFIGAKMGSFFFFEKEEQGLLAVHQGGGMMLYSRVTVTKLPPGSVPVRGPEGVQ